LISLISACSLGLTPKPHEEKPQGRGSSASLATRLEVTFLEFFHNELLRLNFSSGVVSEALRLRLTSRSNPAETDGERIAGDGNFPEFSGRAANEFEMANGT
jgi:hypothetical protein